MLKYIECNILDVPPPGMIINQSPFNYPFTYLNKQIESKWKDPNGSSTVYSSVKHKTTNWELGDIVYTRVNEEDKPLFVATINSQYLSNIDFTYLHLTLTSVNRFCINNNLQSYFPYGYVGSCTLGNWTKLKEVINSAIPTVIICKDTI